MQRQDSGTVASRSQRRHGLLAAAIVCTLGLGAAVVMALLRPEPQPDRTSAPEQATLRTISGDSLTRAPAPDSTTTTTGAEPARVGRASGDAPANRTPTDFSTRLMGFLEAAETLAPDVRERTADTLRDELRHMEREGRVSAGESALLQTAILQAAIDDRDRQRQAVEDLLGHYAQDYEERMDAWRSRYDPAFARYKEQERRLVQEVMTMPEVPGGQDRGEYLRQQLLELRIEAARDAASPE